MKKTNAFALASLFSAAFTTLTPLQAASAEFAIHDGDRVVLLGDSGKVVAATGCQISAAKVDAGVVTFTRKDAALPLPVNPQGESVTNLIPLLADLSRYELKVTGLPAPKYQLLIDDKPAATFTAAELARGCNLTLTAGPVTEQARQLWALVAEKNNVFFQRWREVQLYNPPGWAQTPAFEHFDQVALAG